MRLWNLKRADRHEGGFPGANLTSPRVITENPTAEGCNITWPQGDLGKEKGAAVFQPQIPEVLTNDIPQSATVQGEICYVGMRKHSVGRLLPCISVLQ